MDEQELENLLGRYRRGECTEAECLLVESLYLRSYLTEPVPEDADARERVWKRLQGGLRQRRSKVVGLWLGAAAAIVLIATLALLRITAEESSPVPMLADLPAGGNKAVLKLAGGQLVNLDSSQHGVMILADQLLYTDSTVAGNFRAGQAGDAARNEIITPRGGIYQVVLSDGTKVWLNADSRLIFPQRFAGTKREVTLIGEAYFEVVRNAERPFIVKTPGQEIAVLGTSFNVAAYADNPSEQTTLLEGVVVVNAAQGTRQLVPGEQATVGAQGITVDKVDTSPFVAWKEGFISFNEETLEHIMQDVSRWYDADVHFEGADKQIRFGGMVSRYTNVSEVLRRLELTGQVHFSIEERGIVVKP